MVSPDDRLEPDQATAAWRAGESDAAGKPSSLGSDETYTNAPSGTKPPAPAAARPAANAALPQIPGYELLSLVASGGMGVVYRARDVALDRIVALKVPRVGFVTTAEDKERFLREARAAARLRHPNICPIYEVKEVAGQPYLSMAFIEGSTLRDWALQRNPGPREIAERLATLALAVQFAHDQKVVHRDLKPSNVMVEAHNGEPLLMDFGLAKDLRQEEGLTASGDVLGTPAYMAPEQAAGRVHEIGPLSDVYALGAILYELLGGSAPFQGTVGQLLIQVQNEEPRSLRKVNPQVHADLETICQKAMAKAPQDRYRSAAELAADLQRFARGDAILAKRQPWLKRAWRQASKNRLATALAVSLIIVMLGGGALLTLVPSLSRSLAVTRLSGQLQHDLADDRWHPRQVPAALELIDRLRAVSPDDAELAHASLARRLSDYIKTATSQKLSDAEIQDLEQHIANLERLDARLADDRRANLEAKLGKWQRIVTLRPPFAEAEEWLPGVRRKEGASALVGPQSSRGESWNVRGTMLNSHTDAGNFHLEGRVVLERSSQAAFIVSANEQHGFPVTALAVAPDNKTFVSADRGGAVIRLLRSSDGEEVATLPGHRGPISSLSFSPDGRWLASASWDGEVHLCQTETRKLVKSFSIEVPLESVRRQPTFLGTAVTFDRHGTQLLASSGDGIQGGEVRRWQVPGFAPLPALRPEKPTPLILQVATAPNSDRIAASTFDNRLLLWESAGGKPACDIPLQPPDQRPALVALALHPHANLVAGAVHGVIHLYDPHGKSRGSLQGFAAGAYALRFDPTGGSLAAGYESGHVKVWDVSSRMVKLTIPDYRQRCLALAFSPSGNYLLGGVEAGTIHRWETVTGQEQYQLDGRGYRFVVSRSAEGPVALRIERGGTTLREETIDLGPEPFTLSGRRTGELLELQVNQLRPLVFRDFCPPRPIAQGRWGVQLASGAELLELVVRRSIDSNPVSPLEQGDARLRAGEYANAWELYEQQLAADNSSLTPRLRHEAALKSALCLRYLGRHAEAIEPLRSVSQGDPSEPTVIMARFQLWELLVQQGRLKEGDALFETIRASHSPEHLAEVIPATWRIQMTIEYAQPLLHRSGMVSPGSLARLKTVLAMAEFNQVPVAQTLEWQMHVIAGLRLNDELEESRQQALIALGKCEEQVLKGDPRQRPADVLGKQLELYAFLSRYCGEPRRHEALLNLAIYNAQTGQMLPEMQGERLTLLLEQARLQASLQQWREVTRTLAPLLELDTDSAVIRQARGYASLLQGFAFRHLGDEARAIEAWQRHPFRPASDGSRLDEFIGEDLILWWMLRSLAGDMSSEEATDLFTAVKLRIGGANLLVGQLFGQINISPGALQNGWRSGPGLALTEEVALGNRLPREELAIAIQVGALGAFQQGAFDDNWSPEQMNATWSMVRRAFLAYCRDEISILTMSQLAAAWKGIAPFLGWRSLLTPLPKDLQGPTAYLLGMRYAKRGQTDDARKLWQLTKDFAAEDAALTALADAELAK